VDRNACINFLNKVIATKEMSRRAAQSLADQKLVGDVGRVIGRFL